MVSARPRRPALRYYGGKHRLAPWIISHFPPHDTYVEPFGGAMSVLLQRHPSAVEVYNDLDQEVVTFFRVLRDQPANLLRAIGFTPFSRAEVDLACEPQDDTITDLERARRLYVRAWQSLHGAPAHGRMGWRYDVGDTHRTNVKTWYEAPTVLVPVIDRLKLVQLECDDAFAVLQRFDRPGVLFYVDPPYPASTRGARWAKTAYKHELTDDDHVRLAKLLHALDGMVALSGYDCPLYDELYTQRGWRKVQTDATTQASATATETLWLSPNVAASQQSILQEGAGA